MNEWDLCTTSDELKEKIWTKNRSFSRDVWFRFRHKLTAVIGLIIIILMIIFSFIAPHFTKFKYDEQNFAFSNIPFRMHVIGAIVFILCKISYIRKPYIYQTFFHRSAKHAYF